MKILVTKYKPDRTKYVDKSGTLKFAFQSFIEVELLPDVMRSPQAYDVVCVTSHRAVDWLLEYALPFFTKSQFVCLTHHQAERLKAVHLNARAIEGERRSVLEEWLREQSPLAKVLLLKGNRCLLQKVSGVDEKVVYKTTLSSRSIPKTFDAILFFSPSGLRGFLEGGNEISKNCRVFAFGETTAEAIRNHLTNQVSVSPEPEEEAFIHYVKDELSYR